MQSPTSPTSMHLQENCERKRIEYDEKEITDIKLRTVITLNYITLNANNGNNIMYNNQEICAKQVIRAFQNRKRSATCKCYVFV